MRRIDKLHQSVGKGREAEDSIKEYNNAVWREKHIAEKHEMIHTAACTTVSVDLESNGYLELDVTEEDREALKDVLHSIVARSSEANKRLIEEYEREESDESEDSAKYLATGKNAYMTNGLNYDSEHVMTCTKNNSVCWHRTRMPGTRTMATCENGDKCPYRKLMTGEEYGRLRHYV